MVGVCSERWSFDLRHGGRRFGLERDITVTTPLSVFLV